MKLGFVTAILPELNLNQVLEFAAAEGFAAVELMCWPKGKAERKFAGVTHIDVAGFTQTQADDVNARCASMAWPFPGWATIPTRWTRTRTY